MDDELDRRRAAEAAMGTIPGGVLCYVDRWQLLRELRGEGDVPAPPCARARVAVQPCHNWIGRPPGGWG